MLESTVTSKLHSQLLGQVNVAFEELTENIMF